MDDPNYNVAINSVAAITKTKQQSMNRLVESAQQGAYLISSTTQAVELISGQIDDPDVTGA
ncbi:MAG: hypothetical protein JEZ04_03580 [Spirochaetales bacterium]|nr:hypothetical protein [Spirochaetales bacterium]